MIFSWVYVEDKGDSAGGLDSDSSSSSPAPPQRTGTSVAISGGTHYHTPAGLLKGIKKREEKKQFIELRVGLPR